MPNSFYRHWELVSLLKSLSVYFSFCFVLLFFVLCFHGLDNDFDNSVFS